MSLGDILRNLLEERGISQKELADTLDIGSSTIGNYIQGIRDPDYDVLKSLAEYFDVSIDYLLEYNSNQNISNNEVELIRVYRSLTEDQQELFVSQGKLLYTHSKKKNTI